MIAVEVIALMRRVFSDNVLLDVNQIDQLRKLLETHEQQVRERCAKIAESSIEDASEALAVARAIMEDQQ